MPAGVTTVVGAEDANEVMEEEAAVAMDVFGHEEEAADVIGDDDC